MNMQRWLSFGFFFFFFTWGIFLPYWTGWLTIDKQLSVATASVVMGAGMVIRSLSTFFLFPTLTKRRPLVSVMRLLTYGSIIALILYIPATSFKSLLLITALFSMCYPMILPAMESSATVLMQKEHVHYGKSRSYGSIGYTVAVLVIGALTGIWTERAILYTMMFALVVLGVYLTLRAPSVLTTIDRRERDERRVSMRELFASKQFLAIATVAVLLQGAHTAYYNYGFIYLDDLHVSGLSIGIILNVAVAFEIIFFANADRYFVDVKVSTMLLIASVGSTLRWVLIFVFPTTTMFVLTQGLHALSFGFAHFAFIQYISRQLPTALIASAQGFYAAIAMSLSIAILTFPAGFLYEWHPTYAFLGMTVCTVPALLIVLSTRRRLHY